MTYFKISGKNIISPNFFCTKQIYCVSIETELGHMAKVDAWWSRLVRTQLVPSIWPRHAFTLIRQNKLQVKLPGAEYFVDSEPNWFHPFNLIIPSPSWVSTSCKLNCLELNILILGVVKIIGLMFYCQGLAFYLIPIIGWITKHSVCVTDFHYNCKKGH